MIGKDKRKNSGKPMKRKIKNVKKKDSKRPKSTKVEKSNEPKIPVPNPLNGKQMLRRDRQRSKDPKRFDLASKIKKIWEELRSNASSQEQREVLAKELMSAVKGNTALLASAHDTSRVLQTLLKYGSADQRNEIFEELKPSFVVLMSQKYSVHYLLKVLEYGSQSHRQFITKCIIGNTRRLLKNVNASKIVDEVFSKYAKPEDRRQLVGDLHGSVFRRLMVKGDESMRQIYMSADEETKDRLLRSSKTTLVSFASIGSGRAAQLSIVHAALDDFLATCPIGNTIRQEVIDVWRENMHGLLSSKIGVRCAQHFVWESNAKERKALVKGLKPIISRLLTDSDATPFIISLFDSVDDVILLNKFVVKYLLGKQKEAQSDSNVGSLSGEIEEMFLNPVTRRLLLYIMSPRDAHHFSPVFIQQLKSPVLPDGPLHTKKDFINRLADLRKASKIDDGFLSFLLKKLPELVCELDSDSFLCLITMLNCCDECGEKRAEVYEMFAELIDPFSDKNDVFTIESPKLNIGLRRLIAGDKDRLQAGTPTEDLFISKLIVHIEKNAQSFIPTFISCNRGCYLLLLLLESQMSEIVNRMKQLLEEYEPSLSKQTSSGAKLLLKNISQ